MGAAVSRRIAAEPLGGDLQKLLDVSTHRDVIAALSAAPVAYVGSKEADDPITLQAGAPLAAAIDPLDSSANIGINLPMGTIFSILPAIEAGAEASVLQSDRNQLAAGFLVYGPMTELVLTCGEGTHVFVLDRSDGTFRLTREAVSIAHETGEFAINASNYQHWEEGLPRSSGARASRRPLSKAMPFTATTAKK